MNLDERLPPLTRFANRIGGMLKLAGIGRSKLSLKAIEKKAQSSIRWTNFGNQEYREGAAVFLDSIQSECELNFVGRNVIYESVLLKLKNRLQMEKLLKENGQINDFVDQGKTQKTEHPVFIVGTPRSGTTLLFNLMALDPAARAPRFWEALDPAPPASLITRKELASRVRYHNKRLSKYRSLWPPAIQKIHAIGDAEAYEEDFYLLEPTFRSPSFALVYGPAKRYHDFLYALPDESIVDAYEEFARSIRVLMYQERIDENRYWLGKSPAHAPFAWALQRVFPGATVIHTQRSAAERIPSLCSLVATAESLVHSAVNKQNIGQRVCDYNSVAMEGINRSRVESRINGATVIDVDYRTLKNNPIETVEEVYERIGRKVSGEFESAMKNWQETHNIYDPKKIGTHRYKPEDFGLDKDRLESLEP